jgi:hypothetical protein
VEPETAQVFRYDEQTELIKVLTSIQDAPDNALIKYRVSEDAPHDQYTAVVVDGVVLIHPHNVVGFLAGAPSFHYKAVG